MNSRYLKKITLIFIFLFYFEKDAKNLFNTTRNRQLQRLEFLQKKFGSSITKSKPYYEAHSLTEKVKTF